MSTFHQTDPNYFIPDRFVGKNILITGAARGIGKATAMRAAREGANVFIMDWIKDLGEQTADEINALGVGKAIFMHGSVTETADCDRMVSEMVKAFGSLDYAVNNAGVMTAVHSGEKFDYEQQFNLLPQDIHLATDEYFDGVVKVNLYGTFKSLRAELRQFIAQGKGGAIVNVGSVTSLIGFGAQPAYVSSKHAVSGLTKNAAIDYAIHGIRVNSVNMGTTWTPMVAMAAEWLKARHEAGVQGNPVAGFKTKNMLQLGEQIRVSTVAEQAAIILFLLTDEASIITGTPVPTEGGYSNF
jgi:NAD(P)-dependent dehydrogenase (short-subunit alcohol dehydrogenase family)